MFKDFLPINDFILIKLTEKKTKTDSGIYIPESAQEQKHTGIVWNSGKSTQLKTMDTIHYMPYQGIKLDENYMLIKEEFILGIMAETN